MIQEQLTQSELELKIEDAEKYFIPMFNRTI